MTRETITTDIYPTRYAAMESAGKWAVFQPVDGMFRHCREDAAPRAVSTLSATLQEAAVLSVPVANEEWPELTDGWYVEVSGPAAKGPKWVARCHFTSPTAARVQRNATMTGETMAEVMAAAEEWVAATPAALLRRRREEVDHLTLGEAHDLVMSGEVVGVGYLGALGYFELERRHGHSTATVTHEDGRTLDVAIGVVTRDAAGDLDLCAFLRRRLEREGWLEVSRESSPLEDREAWEDAYAEKHPEPHVSFGAGEGDEGFGEWDAWNEARDAAYVAACEAWQAAH